MTSEKHIKQAVIAVLCGHPEVERYIFRAFSGQPREQTDPIMAQWEKKLTKADFFTADDEGKFIIDHHASWKNFEKVVKAVHAGGEKLKAEDFLLVVRGRTLLESARASGALGKIFTAEVWQGRFDEMERLWYKVPVPDRKLLSKGDGTIPLSLKRPLFAAENREVPEDRLAKAGLKPADVRVAFGDKGGAFDEMNHKLKQAGDYLRKEYVMLPDVSGDTVFDNRPTTWDKYDALVKTMKDNGEKFEVADLTRQVSFVKSILARAAEHKTLGKVFAPAHWEGRLSDMLELWSHVLVGWKASMTARDFDAAYAEAESLTYTKNFESMKVTGKADLLSPLNAPLGTNKPVLPLGLKAVWDKFDAVQSALKGTGEQLTVSDLRAVSGAMENACLMSAVKFGHFDKVVALSKQCGEVVTLADFLSKDRHGHTLLSILAEKNQLALAFAPELWAGRVADMKNLWSHVPANQRYQVDFRQAETSAKQATLKQKKGGFKIQPKKPKAS